MNESVKFPATPAAVNVAPSPVFHIAGLRKSYAGQEVVAGLNLDVVRGTCFGILGPNGAGKTTTLKLCLGLVKPDAGVIRVLGHAVPQDARIARQRVGVVPQMDNLDPDFTVSENLQVYGRYFGLSDAQTAQRIPALLEFANLVAKADARIQTLSGGMKRRLTLARALINDPDLVILDEPTTGLDPQARHMIWERLRQLVAQGKTLILTTHFMEEAERLCTSLAVIDHGKKIAEGSPRALISAHIEPEVVEVYGDGAEDWAAGRAASLSERVEKSGETVFCYTHDATPLANDLAHHATLRSLRRPVLRPSLAEER